jgi:hypothetical protein
MNQSMMKKEERNPKMMAKVKMIVKKMRMEAKIRTKKKVLGASEATKSVGGVNGDELCHSSSKECSKLWSELQRITVANHARTNLQASGNEVVHYSTSVPIVKWRQGWCGQLASLWFIRKRKFAQLRVSGLRSPIPMPRLLLWAVNCDSGT